MKKLLLAVLLACSATTAFADFEPEEWEPSQREIFEHQCDLGVALGIYALARLEMIEVDRLVEKKQQVAPLCKSLGDEEIAALFKEEDAELRFRFGGGQLAAQGMNIDEERRNGKFSKAMVHLIRKRGVCDCEDLEEDLGNYERLVKNHLPMPSVADLEAKSREHDARVREYAFVDACQRGKEGGYGHLEGKMTPAEHDKRFSLECAAMYAHPDVRKTLDPMESLKDLHDEGCRIGVEAYYREKGLQMNSQQTLHRHFHCQSISFSDRARAENTASRRETRRGQIQPAEEAMWQKLREEG